MNIRKIVSLILILTISALSLSSCTIKADKALKKSEKHFRSNAYKVGVRVDFYDFDEELSTLFEQMERTVTTVYFQDGKFRSVNDMDITAGGKAYHFTTMYTDVDGTFYRNIRYSIDGVWQDEVKNWAPISEEESQLVVRKSCIVGGITKDGFTASCVSKINRKKLSISYTGPSETTLVSLGEMMVSLLEGSCESAVATSATLTVAIDANRYESARIDCRFNVIFNNKTYTVSCAVHLEFESDANIFITPPHDISEYVKSELNEITP